MPCPVRGCGEFQQRRERQSLPAIDPQRRRDCSAFAARHSPQALPPLRLWVMLEGMAGSQPPWPDPRCQCVYTASSSSHRSALPIAWLPARMPPSVWATCCVMVGSSFVVEFPAVASVSRRQEQKSRRGGTPGGIRPRRLTRQRAPRRRRVALHLVVRPLRWTAAINYAATLQSP
jgi:hypothetical protein